MPCGRSRRYSRSLRFIPWRWLLRSRTRTSLACFARSRSICIPANPLNPGILITAAPRCRAAPGAGCHASGRVPIQREGERNTEILPGSHLMGPTDRRGCDQSRPTLPQNCAECRSRSRHRPDAVKIIIHPIAGDHQGHSSGTVAAPIVGPAGLITRRNIASVGAACSRYEPRRSAEVAERLPERARG